MLHCASVLLLRHGEKTGSPDDRGLTMLEQARAAALSVYLPTVLPTRPIGALYAAADNAHSERPRRTLQPTSQVLESPSTRRLQPTRPLRWPRICAACTITMSRPS